MKNPPLCLDPRVKRVIVQEPLIAIDPFPMYKTEFECRDHTEGQPFSDRIEYIEAIEDKKRNRSDPRT